MTASQDFESTELNAPRSEISYDTTDKPPKSHQFPYFSIVSNLYSIVLHFVDCGFDIYVAYEYFVTGRYSYGAWSIALLLLPSIILCLLSIRMYVNDFRRGVAQYKHSYLRIVLCIFGIFIQSAPLIRNCDALYYAIKASKAKSQPDKKCVEERYFLKTLNEESDTAFLKLFEAYLESAPQQVLQMTLLLVDFSHGSSIHSTNQIISIVFGFMSMSLSMANYNRCIRFEQMDKQNVSFGGFIVQFLWHLTFTVSRILTISSLATLYPFWTCIAIVIHWCLISIWVAVPLKTTFCEGNTVHEVFFSCAVGAVYIFNIFNLCEGPTKKNYLFFFTLIFIENTIASTIWGVKSTFKNWVYYFFTIFPFVCFVLSIIFIIVYYVKMHPKRGKIIENATKGSHFQ